MLKDNIFKSMFRDNENSAKPLDKFEFPMEGYLKIVQKDEKTGEIIHVDEDHNTVLQWARHATFHCLTGSPFSPYGETRLKNTQEITNHSDEINEDMTTISSDQYFSDKETYNWCESKMLDTSYIYSYYPTKILFGTSSEYDSWASMDETARYQARSLGYTQENFSTNIDDPLNDYSAEFKNGVFVKKRTINDYLLTKSSEIIPSNDCFVKGAVKTTIKNQNELIDKTEEDDDGYLQEKAIWKGVGKPCFIYSNRSGIPESDEQGVLIGRNSDTSSFDNKLTFYFNMPSQDASDILQQNKFYPYNGYLLKEAGLFCDSKLLDYYNEDFDPTPKMSYGIIFCKRYLSPFTKTGSTSVSVSWVLYY